MRRFKLTMETEGIESGHRGCLTLLLAVLGLVLTVIFGLLGL